MKRILLILVIVAVSGPADAILGDFDRDGAVGFLDFFIFADNFGKEGPPDPLDTVYVVTVDTLRQTVRDTVITVEMDTVWQTVRDTVTVWEVRTVTVNDTIYLGLPEIPTPPPPEEQTGIEMDQESLNLVGQSLYGEFVNNTDRTVEGVDCRMILRDASGHILAIESSILYDIYVLAPGDRRPFLFYDVDNLTSVDDLEWVTFEIILGPETNRQLKNDLVLVEETLFIDDKISGEIRNYSNTTVENVNISFVTKNAEGQVTGFNNRAVNFGEPLTPGATGVFQTYSFDTLSHGIYYYIRWGPSYREKDETPYIRLER